LEGPAIIDWTDKIHDFSDTAALIQISTWLYRLILRQLIPLARWRNLFGFSIALTSNGVGYPIVPGIQPRSNRLPGDWVGVINRLIPELEKLVQAYDARALA